MNGESKTSTSRAVKKEQKRIVKLVQRAENGDDEAFSEISKIAEADPALWEGYGDVAEHAERALINLASGKNLILKRAICGKLDSLKTELAGPGAPPLEHLLVERIAGCWLQVYYFDLLHAQNLIKLTREQSEYYGRRQDRAHKRYLSAIKTLAQVRRLLFPAVQVNIGAQQVNKVEVSGDGQAKS